MDISFNKKKQFVVSAIKYRPLSFTAVVGQATIGVTLKNAIQRGHLSHAYLFCGPRGVGKTTCARIFAKTINCLNPSADMEACGECESCRSFSENRSYNIHELDAASNNSVEDIRTLIEKVRIPPQIGRYSVYIIDEVHMLSAAAFNAFLKTLEEPPDYAIFILATTEKHKILPTILSRCQIYDFNRMSIADITSHLEDIAKKESVSIDGDALNIIARKADGAMRDALSIFDRVVSFCGSNITYTAVIDDLNVLDYDYYFKLTDAFLQHNYSDCLIIFDEILKKGFDALHFISGLCSHFRDLLVCKDPKTLSLLETGQNIAEKYRQQATAASAGFLLEALNIANRCEFGYKASGNPRLHVELTLLNLSCIGTEKKNPQTELSPAATTTPASVASTSAPIQEPAKPALPPMPKSVSLKELQKDAITEPEVKYTATNAQETAVKREFTEDELVNAWCKFAEQLPASSTRLKSHLLEHNPKLVDGTVHHTLINEIALQLMEQNRAKLSEYLNVTLQTKNIQIFWSVNDEATQPSQNEKRLYTQQDKLNYICEINPSVQDLLDKFQMDYR